MIFHRKETEKIELVARPDPAGRPDPSSTAELATRARYALLTISDFYNSALISDQSKKSGSEHT